MSPLTPGLRLPYDDADTTGQMHEDCAACEARLPRRSVSLADLAVQPAPSVLFDDFPQDVPKREISIPDAAARLAAVLYDS